MAKRVVLSSSSESEEDVFEVETIVDKKIGKAGQVFYKIKWLNYPESQNTWEKEQDVFAHDAIAKYEASQASKATKKTKAPDTFSPKSLPRKRPAVAARLVTASASASAKSKAYSSESVTSSSGSVEGSEKSADSTMRALASLASAGNFDQELPKSVRVRVVTRSSSTGEYFVHMTSIGLGTERNFSLPSTIANTLYPQEIIAFYEIMARGFNFGSFQGIIKAGPHAINKFRTFACPCSTMKIAIEGCCHGELHTIYRRLMELSAKTSSKIDLLIICGDFQAIRDRNDLNCMACPPKYRHMGDFQDYFNGTSVAPVPTIFIGGNHEASNHMLDLYYGGWVCPNIYYLGASGVVSFRGLRIGGISGIYNSRHYRVGYYEQPPFTEEMIRSAYHFREFEIAKLKKLSGPLDIFVSHEWPTDIYNHGDTEGLLRKKPYFRREVESNQLGASVLTDLMGSLKPKKWFSAHLHVGFDALKRYPDGQAVAFTALDKCLPKRDFLRIIDVEPASGSADAGPAKIEYDPEWLSILRHCEPFLSRSPSRWTLPAELHEPAQDAFEHVSKKLEGSREITCPKVFSLHTAKQQTQAFALRFLSPARLHAEVVHNPEEIELDF